MEIPFIKLDDIDEVIELTNVLLNLEKEIYNAKRFINSELAKETFAAADDIIDDMDFVKGRKPSKIFVESMAHWVSDNTLSPLRFVRRLVGYNDSSPLMTLFNEINGGQHAMMDYQRRAEEMFSKWTNDKEFVKRLGEEVEIDALDVRNQPTKVKITRGMMLSLYMHSLNEQNKASPARA